MKALQRKFLAALLALSLLIGLVPGMGTTAQAAGAAIGQTVTFAGHEWYIIGTPERGRHRPDGLLYPLCQKQRLWLHHIPSGS